MGVDASIVSVPNFNNLEIIRIMTPSLTKAANTELASTTINHNLGFVPILEAHIYDGSLTNPNASSFPLPHSFIQDGLAGASQGDNGKILFYARATATVNSVYIELITPNNSAGNNYYSTASTYKFLILLKRLKITG